MRFSLFRKLRYPGRSLKLREHSKASTKKDEQLENEILLDMVNQPTATFSCSPAKANLERTLALIIRLDFLDVLYPT